MEEAAAARGGKGEGGREMNGCEAFCQSCEGVGCMSCESTCQGACEGCESALCQGYCESCEGCRMV